MATIPVARSGSDSTGLSSHSKSDACAFRPSSGTIAVLCRPWPVTTFFTVIKGTPCGRASRGRAPSALGAACGHPPPRPRAAPACLGLGSLARGGYGRGSFAASFRTPALRTRRPPHVTWPASRRAGAPPSRGRWPWRPSGPPVPLVPGILSPRKDHRQGRACGASHAMAQAPPLPLIFHGKTSAAIERDGTKFAGQVSQPP